MNPDALAILEARCAELDVVIATGQRSDRAWMVRVRKDSVVTSLIGRGPLDAVVAGALDDFEALA
jgi:hypothetical protein